MKKKEDSPVIKFNMLEGERLKRRFAEFFCSVIADPALLAEARNAGSISIRRAATSFNRWRKK